MESTEGGRMYPTVRALYLHVEVLYSNPVVTTGYILSLVVLTLTRLVSSQ